MLEKVLALRELVASNEREFWGWFFLIIGSFSFVGFVYAAIISKLLPPSDNAIIHAIQNDCYFLHGNGHYLINRTFLYFSWISHSFPMGDAWKGANCFANSVVGEMLHITIKKMSVLQNSAVVEVYMERYHVGMESDGDDDDGGYDYAPAA